MDHRAHTRQSFGDGTQFQVRSRYRIPKFQKHFGKPTHADTTDTGEVNWLKFKEHFTSLLFRLSGARVNTVSAALRGALHRHKSFEHVGRPARGSRVRKCSRCRGHSLQPP